jgi:hypothetical protein
LRQKDVVEDALAFDETRLTRSDHVREEVLKSSSQCFGQDLVKTPQKRDRLLVPYVGVVSRFRDQRNETFVGTS